MLCPSQWQALSSMTVMYSNQNPFARVAWCGWIQCVICCAETCRDLTILQQHTFRRPAKPIEPPTPRAPGVSLLGLDRLAQEKRAAAALLVSSDKKRQRTQDDSLFKSASVWFGSRRALTFLQCPVNRRLETSMLDNELKTPHLILVDYQR